MSTPTTRVLVGVDTGDDSRHLVRIGEQIERALVLAREQLDAGGRR